MNTWKLIAVCVSLVGSVVGCEFDEFRPTLDTEALAEPATSRLALSGGDEFLFVLDRERFPVKGAMLKVFRTSDGELLAARPAWASSAGDVVAIAQDPARDGRALVLHADGTLDRYTPDLTLLGRYQALPKSGKGFARSRVVRYCDMDAAPKHGLYVTTRYKSLEGRVVTRVFHAGVGVATYMDLPAVGCAHVAIDRHTPDVMGAVVITSLPAVAWRLDDMKISGAMSLGVDSVRDLGVLGPLTVVATASPERLMLLDVVEHELFDQVRLAARGLVTYTDVSKHGVGGGFVTATDKSWSGYEFTLKYRERPSFEVPEIEIPTPPGLPAPIGP